MFIEILVVFIEKNFACVCVSYLGCNGGGDESRELTHVQIRSVRHRPINALFLLRFLSKDKRSTMLAFKESEKKKRKTQQTDIRIKATGI